MTRKSPFCAIIFLLFLTACKRVEKNVQDYIPVVQTISATAQPDGSVLVKGVVVRSGYTGTRYVGFCMDTNAAPNITTNQVFASAISGDTFMTSYTSLNALKRYYIRAWATNSENYATGKDVLVDSVSFDTTTMQCHLPLSYLAFSGGPVNYNDSYTYFTNFSPSGTDYGFTAYTNSNSIGFLFSAIPFSGVYTTTASDQPGPREVQLTFDGISSKAGSIVYVRQIDNSTIDITICSVPVFFTYDLFDQAWFNLSTRLRVTI